MEKIVALLTAITADADCIVTKWEHPVDQLELTYALPADLSYFLENYKEIQLFPQAEYGITIVGWPDFKRANPVIAGEDAGDDISHHWFIIGNEGNTQYITIDLSAERAGYCYDSFWDRHGVPGEQAIIAKSFTELLQHLYNGRGGRWFWLEEAFAPYGDAYE